MNFRNSENVYNICTSKQKVFSTEYSSYELEIEKRGEVLIYDENMK